MATITQTLNSAATITNIPKKPMRVCFSFAAYSKNLIDHLKTTCNIPIQEGLSEIEFDQIESSLGFTFPPDLRSVLREGLPVGPGFPNWRSSSHQQLEILTSLPILGICKEVSRSNFWIQAWGSRPSDSNEASALARRFLKKKCPVLVPIYRNFYIPSSPNLAGNPVFLVSGSDVMLASFDLTGLFQKVELWPTSSMTMTMNNVPVWTATSARWIEFWSEMAARGRWWSGGGELGVCLEKAFWKLRDGGWKEEEVREMMLMMMVVDGGGGEERETVVVRREKDSMEVLFNRLINGGWSREDVVYSLGCNYCQEDEDKEKNEFLEASSSP